ncbi:3-phosphoshikimate 1-carboxyvinyltransferase [Flavobacterium sp. CYK-55]|uniref:3-phosphoshikimate 1-carboxyvinyltransferase n=1 Tax=Flavobacterium sp. CYK-55 TaxID=2835529 RepID=UPI001BCEEF6D|nr:3-phosphoshikimate 1-carboxyvinyltransferase [Flavobacterium sp. CYK-55]
MTIKLFTSQLGLNTKLFISGSKSETNRLLLLQALYPELTIENASDSDDSKAMREAIQQSRINHQPSTIINVHHAGTAMRFLTAYFATQYNGEVVLTGSERMQQRPIKILVDALRTLGAEIFYLKDEGCPPLRIIGKQINEHHVTLSADVSSQYISALLLIAPKLKNGLELTLEGSVTSLPYIEMTLSLLQALGIETSFKNNVIRVWSASELKQNHIVVESDWSSASYAYSLVALSDIGTQMQLSNFKQNSFQGDSALVHLYASLGVQSEFLPENILQLTKVSAPTTDDFQADLNHSPDIAQTISVTCLGLGITCQISGLHTLKIKETDRLYALKTELEKLGAEVHITDNSLAFKATKNLHQNISIATYQDHRMAMAFAPLALRVPIIIEQAEVVSKSYPAFWNDVQKAGIQIEQSF